jgi:drug/metabolite transporter (DMT)-like permease
VSFGWVFLGASVVAYGVANFLQSVAASRVTVHAKLDPGLLLRLASHRTYIAGLLCQLGAFFLAFMARRDLPLFLVQTAVAAGLGVTVLLGVLLLRWRHPATEVLLMGTLVAGLAALIISAEVSQSRPLNTKEVLALALSVPLVGLLGRGAVRLHGAPGSVTLGALSGLSFGAVAIASRPLASAHTVVGFLGDPLLYILLAHTVVAQLLLGLAMQRGSTTAAVAAMDAAAAIPPALVGLLLLGDKIAPGREWLAAAGFVLALGSVLLLSRYAEPQHHVRADYEARCARRAPRVQEPRGASAR